MASRRAARARGCRLSTALPAWHSVLAVAAHPDDESFGLGALLSTFADHGATVSVLCFTRGEASTPHGIDGDLSGVELMTLADEVTSAINTVGADGIIGFDVDGVTGHPDHRRATQAALEAADAQGLPILGWTVRADVAATLDAEFGASFSGHDSSSIDVVVPR